MELDSDRKCVCPPGKQLNNGKCDCPPGEIPNEDGCDCPEGKERVDLGNGRVECVCKDGIWNERTKECDCPPDEERDEVTKECRRKRRRICGPGEVPDADGDDCIPEETQVEFLETKAVGKRFAFILDKSSSMVEGCSGEHRVPEARRRWTILVKKIEQTLSNISDQAEVYFVAFSKRYFDVVYDRGWVNAVQNRDAIMGWLRGIELGGETYPKQAITKVTKLEPAADAYFFLTDGDFTDGAPGVIRHWKKKNITERKTLGLDPIPVHTFTLVNDEAKHHMKFISGEVNRALGLPFNWNGQEKSSRYQHISYPGLYDEDTPTSCSEEEEEKDEDAEMDEGEDGILPPEIDVPPPECGIGTTLAYQAVGGWVCKPVEEEVVEEDTDTVVPDVNEVDTPMEQIGECVGGTMQGMAGMEWCVCPPGDTLVNGKCVPRDVSTNDVDLNDPNLDGMVAPDTVDVVPIEDIPQTPVEFMNVEDVGSKIAFVLDKSSSMTEYPEHVPNPVKWVLLKREVLKTVATIGQARFLCAFFSHSGADQYFSREWLDRNSWLQLKIWMNGIVPFGATNPLVILRELLSMGTKPDLIYLVTDGKFTGGGADLQTQNEVVSLAVGLSIPIHCISLVDTEGIPNLMSIAQQTGGTFKHIL